MDGHLDAFTDYTLARRAQLAAVHRAGVIGREDVCDAHPELVRAARHLGRSGATKCPVCEEQQLRRIAYAFGASLGRRNGRALAVDAVVALRGGPDVRCYVVEVCTACGWNHLTRCYGVRGPEAGEATAPSAGGVVRWAVATDAEAD